MRELLVKPGDAVNAGETIALLESMKMEIPCESAATGVVSEVRCAPGEVVAEGSVLAVVLGEATDVATADEDVDLDAVPDALAALRTRLAMLDDASRPKAVERRRSRGQLTAREQVALLCGILPCSVLPNHVREQQSCECPSGNTEIPMGRTDIGCYRRQLPLSVYHV